MVAAVIMAQPRPSAREPDLTRPIPTTPHTATDCVLPTHTEPRALDGRGAKKHTLWMEAIAILVGLIVLIAGAVISARRSRGAP